MSAAFPRFARRVVTIAATAVLAVTGALLVPPDAGAAPNPARRPAVRQSNMADGVFRHLNYERSLHGLRPLTMSADLVHSAHRHNLRMARFNVLSHQLPGEAFFATRILKAGYHWLWAGENIGWNSRMTYHGVIRLEQMMYHEKPPNDGHRVNILSPHYRNVGVDVYLDPKHHKVWLTTDFGRR